MRQDIKSTPRTSEERTTDDDYIFKWNDYIPRSLLLVLWHYHYYPSSPLVVIIICPERKNSLHFKQTLRFSCCFKITILMNHHHSPNEFLRHWLRAAELSKHTYNQKKHKTWKKWISELRYFKMTFFQRRKKKNIFRGNNEYLLPYFLPSFKKTSKFFFGENVFIFLTLHQLFAWMYDVKGLCNPTNWLDSY